MRDKGLRLALAGEDLTYCFKAPGLVRFRV